MAPKHADSVICPKCGYDQSGIVESWTDRCPLSGRCAECGLEFDWADVMDPKRVCLPWYTEHATGPMQMLRRTPGTIIRLMYPPVFWSRVGVMMELRLRRLVLWSLAVAFAVHLCASVFVGLGNWADNGRFQYGSFSSYLSTYGFLGVIRLLFNAILNGIAYMEFDPAGDPIFGLGVTYYSSHSGSWFVFLPYAGMVILWLVVLLAIPTTRRLAKLRGVHIARATIISLLAIWIIFEGFRAVIGIDIWLGLPLWLAMSFGWLILAMGGWFLLFWGSAVRTGWEIGPSWLLIILGTIASILGGLVAAALPTLLS